MKKLYILVVIFLPLFMTGCEKRIVDTSISIYGMVIDADNNTPLQGAMLTLSPGSRNRYTGSDGTYIFEDLNAQQYTITVQLGGYHTDRKTVRLMAGEQEEVTFSLKKE